MSGYAWAIWVCVGVALLIIELIGTTFYLLWAGLAAIVAGVCAWVFPEVWWVPWVTFVVVGIVLLLITRRYLHKLHGMETVPSNVETVIGKQGQVIDTIDARENRGRVRIDSEEWRARGPGFLQEGARVEVQAIQGATLIVVAIDEAETAPEAE